jgi:hypothetical protein
MGETAKAQRLPERKTLRAEFFVLPIKEAVAASPIRRITLSPFRIRLLDSKFWLVALALRAAHRLLCPL